MSGQTRPDSSEITFVIQGPENPALQESIVNIKIIFPNSKIILSSTSSYSTNYHGADSVVISSDPGALPYTTEKDSRPNNTNRQIVSTLAGMREVKTKYVFKLRSDFIFKSDMFLNFHGKYPKSSTGYKLFEEKVLVCSFYSRNPNSHHKYPFYISDLVHFGLTKDVIRLFDIPLMTHEEQRFIKKGHISSFRYHPEQHILLSCLKQGGFEYDCEYYNHTTTNNILETERIFASNFMLLSFDQFGIHPTKKTFFVKNDPGAFSSCYTHIEWLELYKKYCDPDIVTPEFDPDRAELDEAVRQIDFYKSVTKFITFVIPIPRYRKEIRRKILNILSR